MEEKVSIFRYGSVIFFYVGTFALILFRFDPFLLFFDLKKTFIQIALPECDLEKLFFMWYNNVKNGDFTVQAESLILKI